jgi:hypothetical protein
MAPCQQPCFPFPRPFSARQGYDEDLDAAQMAAGEVITELEARADHYGAEGRDVALLAVLDIASAPVGFGGVRNSAELIDWLRSEVPTRAAELVGARRDDIPPLVPARTPREGARH